MKKLVLSLLITLSTLAMTQAQVNWSINFGVGNSNNSVQIPGLIGSNPDPNNLTNFYLGVGFGKPITSKLSVNPELLFTQRGNNINDRIGEARTVVDYLVLPVWLDYEAIKRLHIRTGFEFGYVLAQRLRTTNTRVIDENSDIGKRTDLGLMAGIRYQAGKRILVDLRFIWGLTAQYRPYYINSRLLDPNSQERFIQLTNENALQRSFQFGVSYVLFKND